MSAGNRKYPYRPTNHEPVPRQLNFVFILVCAIIAGLAIGTLMGLVIR